MHSYIGSLCAHKGHLIRHHNPIHEGTGAPKWEESKMSAQLPPTFGSERVDRRTEIGCKYVIVEIARRIC